MYSKRERSYFSTGIIFCLLTVGCQTATAQNTYVVYGTAVEYYHNAEYTLADSLFLSLEGPLTTTGDHETLSELYAYRSATYRRQGHLAEARHLLDLAEETALSTLGPNHIVLSRIYNNRTFLLISESEFEAAMEWAKKSLQVALTHPAEFARRAESWLTAGYVYDLLGEYNDAITAYNNGLTEAEKGLENDTRASLLVMISLNNNLGVVNRQLGNTREALAYYEANQHLIDARFHSEHPEAAHNFNNIGSMLFQDGDAEEAISYFLRAAAILEKNFGPAHLHVAAAYNNTGSAYALLNRPAFAADYFEKALDIKLALQGENHLDTAVAYANLAQYEWDAGNHVAALARVTQSIQIRKEILGDQSLQLIMPWLLRGEINLDLGQPAATLEDMERVLSLSIPRLGPTHRHSIEAGILRATALRQSGKLEAAMESVEQILSVDRRQTSESGSLSKKDEIPFPYPQLLLDALSEKALILNDIYDQGMDTGALVSAFETWNLCIDVLEELQIHFRRGSSLIKYENSNDTVFDNAIDTSFRLYSLSGDSTYIDMAFTIMERSKARVARAFLTEADARVISGVPEYYIRREEDFRHEFNRVERELIVEMTKNSAPDRVLIRSLQDSLFQIRLQQQSYSELLEKSYPRYYQLKFDRKVAGLESVRNQLATSESSMISYFAGSEYLYAVTISVERAGFYRLLPVSELEVLVNSLREETAAPGSGTFSQTAHELYNVLVEPLKSSLTTSGVVILPDRILNYLPFEMLLTQKVSGKNYHKWPWMLLDSTISYAPSATVLQQMERVESPGTNKLLMVAPFATGSALVRNGNPDVAHPQNLSQLPFSRYEAEEITRIFTSTAPAGRSFYNRKETTILMNREATAGRIRNLDLNSYRYIHFATHALVNDREPALSGIRMAEDGTGDNTLFLHDIYRFGLNAEMVVLSGCESGFGPISGGEGVIGFARAFILGGASSLITSLWKVDDRSTAELMTRFYRELLQGESKSTSLRKAKLAMINNPGTSSPSRWGAFILAGL